MTKAQVRLQLLQCRKHIENRAEKDKRIADYAVDWAQKYASIMLYASIGTEVDTYSIYKRLQKKTLYLPFTTCDKCMHAALLRCPLCKDKVDKWGNAEVFTDRFYDGQAELIFVPLLGFDNENYRIGYGTGCYDRYFAQNSGGERVGLAYEEQLCTFPHDSTDIPLNYIITPQRIIRRTV